MGVMGVMGENGPNGVDVLNAERKSASHA